MNRGGCIFGTSFFLDGDGGAEVGSGIWLSFGKRGGSGEDKAQTSVGREQGGGGILG